MHNWRDQIRRLACIVIRTLILQFISDKLQLTGVTCMLIASKFEEIYAPEVNDFVYITDNAYTFQNIIDMEVQLHIIEI